MYKIHKYLNLSAKMINILVKRSFTTSRLLQSSKGKGIDRSKVPKLVEGDIDEKFIKGWGPGGQSVNKTTNAVFLRHLPTGVWVKCHESRSLDRNRKVARTMLIERLDEKLNGEQSVANQEKRNEALRSSIKKEKTRLKYEKIKADKLAEANSLKPDDNLVVESESEESKDIQVEVDNIADNVKTDDPSNKSKS